MARIREPIIFIDSHIVMWLFSGLKIKFNQNTHEMIEKCSVSISPIVMLELEYLYEIKRIKYSAKEIFDNLNWSLDLQQSANTFPIVIEKAKAIKWTRDVFDRIIVADAAIKGNTLITTDRKILKNYSKAIRPN